MKPKASLPRDVARLRQRMDRLNARLVAVLQERALLALAISRTKRGHGLATVDPAREREMLRLALHSAPPGFSRAVLKDLLLAVFDHSRSLVVHDSRRAASKRRATAGKRRT